jgi:hypothetical protein
MKKIFLFLSVPLVVLCSFIPSEDKKPPATTQEVHDRFVESLFTAEEDYTKDKSISMKVKPYPEEPEMTRYIGNYCEAMISIFYGGFQQAIDEKAGYTWHEWYGDSFVANYKRLLGTNLIKKRVETKTGTKFNYFDAVAIETTFKALYKKPTDKFKGIATYQRIYDASMKEFAIESAAFIADVMQNKKGFEEVTAKYKKAMETSEEFYGSSLPEKVWETIFDKSKLQKDGDYYYYPEKKCGYTHDILLTMVRRNIDGTLPTLLKFVQTNLARLRQAHV